QNPSKEIVKIFDNIVKKPETEDQRTKQKAWDKKNPPTWPLELY
ncbi:6334_t:CDS:1, partial [Ambispora leptoticha]